MPIRYDELIQKPVLFRADWERLNHRFQQLRRYCEKVERGEVTMPVRHKQRLLWEYEMTYRDLCGLLPQVEERE
ncbi:MAG TPA: hypothetical protein VIM84_08835 [Gemmatimonadales bacterium]